MLNEVLTFVCRPSADAAYTERYRIGLSRRLGPRKGEEKMATTTRWRDSDRTKLTKLMDKLTAVTMDLKPLCGPERPMKQSIPIESTIAAACSIMQTAVDDLRDVIKHLDGMSRGAREPAAAKPARKPAKLAAKRPESAD